tara:strand:- start:106 stop:726 length:621 start_codon:yes stop_codon:yes gene_type:complete
MKLIPILFFILMIPLAYAEGFNITSPSNNTLIDFFDTAGERFEIDFKYSINTSSICSLFLNDTLEESQNATSGTNTFSIDEFNTNQTIKYNVECNLTGTPLNSSFHVFSVGITEVIQFFNAGQCRTDTGSVLMLGLFIITSFILIGMGLSTRIGFIGVLGSLMLMFSSIYLATCATVIATILIFLSILMFFMFIFRSFFPTTTGGS